MEVVFLFILRVAVETPIYRVSKWRGQKKGIQTDDATPSRPFARMAAPPHFSVLHFCDLFRVRLVRIDADLSRLSTFRVSFKSSVSTSRLFYTASPQHNKQKIPNPKPS